MGRVTLKKAKEVVEIEAAGLREMARRIDRAFLDTVEMIFKSKGRVVVTGMGKAGIVARKIAATLSSTGTPSLWMHSAEGVHGDLGQIERHDVVIIVSNSGETEETKRLLPILKRIGTRIVAVTGNTKSALAKHSDTVLDASVRQEGCPLGVAPMASTTAALVMGDALAACLILRRGFKREDYAFFHPGGSLGRKLLLKVEDVMREGDQLATVRESMSVKDVLLAITKARSGSACVLNSRGTFSGIFTDGDLRRHLEAMPDLLERRVKDVMTRKPITIRHDRLAVEALQVLRDRQIDELPVLGARGKLVGLVDVQDLLRAGLV